MKYLILVLALFAAFALTAQDSIRVTLYADSTYIIENIYNDDDGIPTRVDVVRANGPTELAGYFYAVANQAFADYEAATKRYRETERGAAATLRSVNNRLASLGLPEYFERNATLYGPGIEGTYRWTGPGLDNVAVTVNANLRFNPGTGVHQVRILKPGFIRITQAGVQVADLYLQGRRYISFDGRYTLRINQLTIQNR
jgi:hypothetical protein